jgi:hypothetical protein
MARVADDEGDLRAAFEFTKKSLAINEELGNSHGAANDCGQLGLVSRERHQYVESGEWLIRSVKLFRECSDHQLAKRSERNFAITLGRANTEAQEKLASAWKGAGLGPMPRAE